MGFDTFNVGPELEYFLFRDDKGTETLDEGGYFAMTTMDAATELRNDTIKALESMGIPIEYHHHEVAPAQHELGLKFAPDALLQTALLPRWQMLAEWNDTAAPFPDGIALHQPFEEQARRAPGAVAVEHAAASAMNAAASRIRIDCLLPSSFRCAPKLNQQA